MIGTKGLYDDSSAPDSPAMKYSVRKRVPPSRASTRGPKKNSTSRLKKMCQMLPCTNMYVIGVHGALRNRAAANERMAVRSG